MNTRAMLLGRRRRPAAIWFGGAVACSFVGVLLTTAVGPPGLAVVVLGPAVCTAAHAGRNDGLLTSWAIAGVGGAAMALLFIVGSRYPSAGPAPDLLTPMAMAWAGTGVVLGSIAFGIGVAARKLRGQR